MKLPGTESLDDCLKLSRSRKPQEQVTISGPTPAHATGMTCVNLRGGVGRNESPTPPTRPSGLVRSPFGLQKPDCFVERLETAESQRHADSGQQGKPGFTPANSEEAPDRSDPDPEESCPPGGPLPVGPASQTSLHLGLPGPASGRRGHPLVNRLLQNTTKAGRSRAALQTLAGGEVVPRPPTPRVTSMAARSPHFHPAPPTDRRFGLKVALLRRPRPRVSKATAPRRSRFRFRLRRWLPASPAPPRPAGPAPEEAGRAGRSSGRGPVLYEGVGAWGCPGKVRPSAARPVAAAVVTFPSLFSIPILLSHVLSLLLPDLLSTFLSVVCPITCSHALVPHLSYLLSPDLSPFLF